jgi:hypothetical protein
MFHRADGPGMSQSLRSHPAGGQFHAIMLLDLFGRLSERVVGAKVGQHSLQRQGIVPILYLGLGAERPHLLAVPSLAQAQFQEADLSIGRVPLQGFFFP